MLYVRLISRKGPIFRISKLNYPEIAEIEKCAGELVKCGLLENEDIDELDLISVFTKKEIYSVAKAHLGNTIKSNDPRDLLVLKSLENQNVVADLIKMDHFLWTSYICENEFFHLLFFGNLEQSLSDFILEDIGVLKYEPYEIRTEDRLFKTRVVADRLYDLIGYQYELWEAREMEDTSLVLSILKAVNQLSLTKAHLKTKRAKLNLRGAEYLEKMGEHKKAIKYYKLSLVPPASERMVRTLFKMEDYKQALRTCEGIEKSPLNYSEVEFATKFKQKILKELDRPFEKIEIFQCPISEIKIAKNPQKKIEQLALDYFSKKKVKGIYSENYLWLSLFGLCFWDIIFKPMDQVFFHPFQRGPKDLFWPEFHLRRGSEIKKRIDSVRSRESWKEELLQTYREKKWTANYLVSWKKVGLTELKLVLSKVKSSQFAAIFEAMAFDLRDAKSGFPDLFLYDPKLKQYKLCEVKGPGDTLRPGQKRWIRFFQTNQIPFELLKVTYL
ncbi:MAG: VRR-NUC domain-containing protein [Bacteriovoracaceae bacterium]|jgi:tetratricopeptide (TPR) repeat protein|nr:VRR-NUC domain-containing protein [Bacteriovoracaceae bacterium]